MSLIATTTTTASCWRNCAAESPARRSRPVRGEPRRSLVGSGAGCWRIGPSCARRRPTPLAGRTIDIEIEDADGSRRIQLHSVLPGRRYVIGKGEGCDIVVNGVYASRRHCEIWLDHGAWWVTDAGSTNGLRVERGRERARAQPRPPGSADQAAVLEVVDGRAHRPLGARATGTPRHYPRVGIDGGRDADALSTPIAAVACARSRRRRRLSGRERKLALDDHRADGLRRAHRRASAPPRCRSPSAARAARRS